MINKITGLLNKIALHKEPHENIECKAANISIRLLVIANANIPTVQLSLLTPLTQLIEDKKCHVVLLTEQQIKERFGKVLRSFKAWEWVKGQFITANPTHMVFCRYSGPHAESLLEFSRSCGVPSVYCIDDDLLNVPLELGRQKFDYHNHPRRLKVVRYLLNNADLVYCSNERLKNRLINNGVHGNLHAGQIFCAGQVISPVELRPIITIGYMGFDHAHDFEIVLPALVDILRKYPKLRFELFGKIPKPPALNEFKDRITEISVVSDYEEFLNALASRKWDIGICPLAPTDFNRVKNINKWIEYTSVGAAVIASRGLIYDECCSDDCGQLVDDQEWFTCFEYLIENSEERFRMVKNAQERLANEYSVEKQLKQLNTTLTMAKDYSLAQTLV